MGGLLGCWQVAALEVILLGLGQLLLSIDELPDGSAKPKNSFHVFVFDLCVHHCCNVRDRRLMKVECK